MIRLDPPFRHQLGECRKDGVAMNSETLGEPAAAGKPGGQAMDPRAVIADPRWHAHVEIDRERYKEIRDHLLDLAVHRTPEGLALEFYHLPFEPYAPIRRQMLNMLRAVNRKRKAAGYSVLPVAVLPLRRRIVQPFGLSYREQVIDEPKPVEQSECEKPLRATEPTQAVPALESERGLANEKPRGEPH
jgi:hypothetical protein